MRRTAIGVSVVVHALLCALVARRDGPRQGAAVDADLAPVPIPVEAAPIEVVMLPASTAGASASAGAGPRGLAPRPIRAVPTAGDETSATRAPAASGATEAPPTLPAANLQLDPVIAHRIATSGTSATVETKVSGLVDRVPGGGGVVHDAVTTMKIERDGTAHFHDEKDIDVHLVLPVPPSVEEIRTGLGALLTDWYRDPYAGTRFGPTSQLSNAALAAPGACDTWGSSLCDDPFAPESERKVKDYKRVRAGLGIGLAGKLDVSSWLQRKLVGDPFASRKLKLLDATRDERAAAGGQFRSEQLARSAELMTQTLQWLWQNERDPAHRREALFELWDDCAEGDEEAGAAGERARTIVIGWIRGKLPAGSPGAYSDEELRALGARRHSKQPFTPY